jgi:hypothetical protein
MSRQYFQDTVAEPPLTDATAIVATTETLLWDNLVAAAAWPANVSTIPAFDLRPGKIYKVTAGGVYTSGASGTLVITPRFGLTQAAGITLGANLADNVPVSLTGVPWHMEFNLVCRTVGKAGLFSTVIGTGFFLGSNTGTVGTALGFAIGGTLATVDASLAQALVFGWTLSIAGSVTPKYVNMQTLN